MATTLAAASGPNIHTRQPSISAHSSFSRAHNPFLSTTVAPVAPHNMQREPSGSGQRETRDGSSAPSTSYRHPRTLEDLTRIARDEVKWEVSHGVSFWLNEGERHRDNAKSHTMADADLIFIDLVKSTNILYALQKHPDYNTYLDAGAREVMRQVRRPSFQIGCQSAYDLIES
jgi:hypothetical protein